MSRFGEPKPVERIKVLPQKTIKKVASKHKEYIYRKKVLKVNEKSFSRLFYY